MKTLDTSLADRETAAEKSFFNAVDRFCAGRNNACAAATLTIRGVPARAPAKDAKQEEDEDGDEFDGIGMPSFAR